MEKRKIFNIISGVALSATVLTGCGKKAVTAESLIEGGFGNKPATSISSNVKFDIKGSSDMSASGLDGEMSYGVNADLDIDLTNEGESHTKGTVGFNLFGMSFDTNMESYTVKSEGDKLASYECVSFEDSEQEWVKSELDASSYTDMSSKLAPSMDYIQDDSMLFVENDDTYEVVAVLDNEKCAALLKSIMGDNTSLSDFIDVDSLDDDLKDAEFNVTMTFDKKTKLLTKEEIVLNPASIASDKTKFEIFKIEMTIKELNNVTVSVPEEVKQSATEVDYSDGLIPLEDSVEEVEEFKAADGAR